MLALRFLWVGKSDDREYARAVARYVQRISPWAKVEETIVRPERARGPEAARREGERMLAALKGREKVVALDAGGRAFTSETFARWLARHRDSDPRPLALLVGGASGLSPDVLARAEEKISLSPLTLPHQLVRVVLLEQVYRALSIGANLRYH